MKRAWMAAVVLGAAMTSGTAFAQEIPVPAWSAATGAEDVVVLKDGGAVRGLVMEVLPNDHVTVKLADGRTATIVWSVIHHIEQAPHAPTTTPPETPADKPAPTPEKPSTASAPTPVVTGSVHVRMEGDNDAVLEQDHNGAWGVICSGACDRDLPLDAMYRVNGSGVRTSGAFRLQGTPGDQITLHLNTGSSAGFSGGVTLAVLGGLTATVGFWGMYVALLTQDNYDYEGNSNNNGNAVAAWAVTTLVGAAVGTIGLVMAVSNEKTKIVQTAGTSEKSARTLFAPPKPTTETASLAADRQPTWLNLRPAGVPAAPTSTLFSVNF